MAVTWTVSDLDKGVQGNKRVNTGTITASGTTSDDGDAAAASLFGMSVLEDLQLSPFLDSTSNPENAFVGTWNKNSGKIVLHTAHGTPGDTVPLIQAAAAATVTGYFARFRAVGR